MRSRSRVLLLAAVVLPVVLALVPAHPPRRDASQPLAATFWIWNTGPRIDRDAVAKALGLGVEPPFVKAGTFSLDRDSLSFRPECGEEDLPAGTYRWTYSFEPSVVRGLERIGPDALARAIAEAHRGRRGGVQVDLDCPTRLLPLYARSLHAVHGLLPRGTELSTTTLLSWLDEGALDEVLAEVDFHVPMAFGYRVPQTVEEVAPIADREHVIAAMAACERRGRPYWMGLGAYGYVLSFGPDGRLAHVHGQTSPRALLRQDVAWEDGLLRARSPVELHGLVAPAGTLLRHDRVAASEVAAWIAELRREAGPACRGVVVFRIAGKDDPLALSDRGFAGVLRGNARVRPSIRIEGEGASIRAVLANEGEDDSTFAPGSSRLTVRLSTGRFEECRAGGFERVEGRAGAMRSSVRRARDLTFEASWLGAGEELATGPIRLAAPCEGEAVAEVETSTGKLIVGPVEFAR